MRWMLGVVRGNTLHQAGHLMMMPLSLLLTTQVPLNKSSLRITSLSLQAKKILKGEVCTVCQWVLISYQT